jgi:hypothetical protein
MSMRVLLDGKVIQHETVVTIAESAKLHLSIEAAQAVPSLTVADVRVPLVHESGARWTADDTWIDSEATVHLVGDCDLMATDGSGRVVRALLRRRPTRITEAQYRFLLEALRLRLGSASQDPLARTRVWASMAPRVPTGAEERGLVLLQLFARAAPALRAVAARPLAALVREDEWRPVSRLAGVRSAEVDGRRIRARAVPWPLPAPVHGYLPLRRAAERLDTAENRYSFGVVRHLLAAMLVAAEADVSTPTMQRLTRASRELDTWFAGPFWRQLPFSGTPTQSFILRDHPDYQVIAWLGAALTTMNDVAFGVPPVLAEEAVPITPWSLNVLYERWVQCLVREWLETRLGTLAEPVRFHGSSIWPFPRGGHVVLRLDLPFPRHRSRGLFAGSGKNRPDIAVEIRSPDRPVDLAIIDATYSRSRALHEEKLSYARTIRDGSSPDPLTGVPRLATRWTAVVFPGTAAGAEEIIGSRTQMLLSVPPSPEGAQLVGRWLSNTVGACF